MYMLMETTALIGLLADKFPSRRILFTFGLLVMAISTALYWIGTTIFMLVAARALQGLSATAVWVVGMAIINDVSGPDDLGISMSYVWSANTLGLLCGPIIGGTLYVPSYLREHPVSILVSMDAKTDVKR